MATEKNEYRREITAANLMWFHVDCRVCFEDVLGLSYVPTSCPLCGNRNGFKAVQVGLAKGLEIKERIEAEPYYEKKKAWKLKDVLKEYAEKYKQFQKEKGGTNGTEND